MNPLDIHGPEFLGVYLAWLLASYVASLVVTELLRIGGLFGAQKELNLHPYEIAYLNGGSQHVLLTAYANLLQNHVIGLSNDRGTVRLRVETNPANELDKIHRVDSKVPEFAEINRAAKELEESIACYSNGLSWNQAKGELHRFDEHMAKFRERLTAHNLVVSPFKSWIIKGLSTICVLIPPVVLAIPRLVEAIPLHRPVIFLVVLTLISFFVVYKVMTRNVVRTHGGHSKLKEVIDKNWGLYESSNSLEPVLSRNDLLLGFALFGLGMTCPLTEAANMFFTNTAYLPDPNVNYTGTTISGWNDAPGHFGVFGGGCGGGGCGGGGCGGGGCGGCGG